MRRRISRTAKHCGDFQAQELSLESEGMACSRGNSRGSLRAYHICERDYLLQLGGGQHSNAAIIDLDRTASPTFRRHSSRRGAPVVGTVHAKIVKSGSPANRQSRLSFMKTSTVHQPKKLTGKLLAVLVLLGISVFINYIDRGNLSIAAPMLKDELRISATQLGILLSAFFWTYACSAHRRLAGGPSERQLGLRRGLLPLVRSDSGDRPGGYVLGAVRVALAARHWGVGRLSFLFEDHCAELS